MPLKLKGSSSGDVTLDVPAAAGTNTLTLPAATGTINTSGAVNQVPAGSAAAPAISPTGDTNTGVFFPAADTVAFSEGGVESARFDSSGNLLVGTTTTGGKVSVVSNATSATTTALSLANNGGGTTPGVAIDMDPTGNGVNVRSARIVAFNSNSSTATNLLFQTPNGAPPATRMTIASDGVITIANLAGTGSRAVNADANGALSAASDKSLKQEVIGGKIPGLSEILQIQPKAYRWLNDIKERGDEAAIEIGFFANDVAPIIPSAAPKGIDGLYGFYDRSITAALVKAVQELSAELNEAKARITALEAK